MKGILQRRYVSPARGAKESRACQRSRRPWKGRRIWKSSPEGLLGVGGAECWDSHQSNKGDLTGSGVHSPRKAWYKHVDAKSEPEPCEKSEGQVVPVKAWTTEPARGKLPCVNWVERGEK